MPVQGPTALQRALDLSPGLTGAHMGPPGRAVPHLLQGLGRVLPCSGWPQGLNLVLLRPAKSLALQSAHGLLLVYLVHVARFGIWGGCSGGFWEMAEAAPPPHRAMSD